MKKPVFIIAKAGVNHNGSLDLAYRLIDGALEAGADAVKFQTFRTELSIAKQAPKANYQVENTGSSESQYEMVKKLELSYEQFAKLKAYCDSKHIEFMSTPFDLPSVDFLESLAMRVVKIASGEIVNLPLLRKIARLDRKLILSSGVCTLADISAAVEVLTQGGRSASDITVLHCNTEYPTPFDDVHLRAMQTIRDELGVEVGYSDHTVGIEIPIAAVALGATVIEKHFTIDKTLPGPDHVASIDLDELKAMVAAIRNVENALGRREKTPSASEAKNLEIARKSIVASRKITRGESFSEANLAVKRPGSGISPMKWDMVIGKLASRDFNEDELIEL